MAHLTIPELEAQLATTAANFVQTTLGVARLSVESEDMRAVLDGLTAAALTVRVDGQKVEIEMLAPVQGGTLRVYAASFEQVPGVLN